MIWAFQLFILKSGFSSKPLLPKTDQGPGPKGVVLGRNDSPPNVEAPLIVHVKVVKCPGVLFGGLPRRRKRGMSVSQKIIDHLANEATRTRVKDVRIGLGYTAVMLENGQTGVAFTFQEKRGITIQ